MASQQLADNSMNGGDMQYYDKGGDSSKLRAQEMPNTRQNDYITNRYSGPHSKMGKVKVKGKSEHIAEEDEFGDDYGA